MTLKNNPPPGAQTSEVYGRMSGTRLFASLAAHAIFRVSQITCAVIDATLKAAAFLAIWVILLFESKAERLAYVRGVSRLKDRSEI